MPIKAPYLPYETLAKKADDFLSKYHPIGTIPVPIESIVEFQFGIDIIELPGLRDLLSVDAFPSRDLTEFYIDQFVYRKRLNRYRFNLAHEIAHVVLHADVFQKVQFTTAQEWLDVVQNAIPTEEHSWIEWQAYTFGGLILVPPNHLRIQFDSMIDTAEGAGLVKQDIYADEAARKAFESHLGARFEVSGIVIEKRLKKDGLWEA